MSLLNGKENNSEFNENENKENLYYNICKSKMADTKENVIITKIDKEKLPVSGESSWLFTVTRNECFSTLRKAKQKEYLEIFMIIDQISRKNDIISFSYDGNFLMVQTGLNDYYRILIKEVKEC